MLSRELVAASSEPLILSLLSAGESYGYAIIQEMSRRSGDRLQWTEGTIYPVLHRLEQKGLIKANWRAAEDGRKRKYYILLPKGRKLLEKRVEEWSMVNAVLTGLRAERHV